MCQLLRRSWIRAGLKRIRFSRQDPLKPLGLYSEIINAGMKIITPTDGGTYIAAAFAAAALRRSRRRGRHARAGMFGVLFVEDIVRRQADVPARWTQTHLSADCR